jgi:hypothetical protein
MPTPTYTLIDSVTLTSSASSVTFSSIDQSYGDLVIVLQLGTSSPGSTGAITFNGDGGSNYSFVRMEGDGSAATSASGTSSSMPIGGNIYTDTGNTFNAIIQIADYSATDKHKSIIHRVNQTVEPTYSGVGAGAQATRWANTAAITTIFIPVYGATFTVGSTFFLYGIAKAL